MTPYYQDEYVTLYCADCAVVLPTLEQHDLLLTDPPYGILGNRHTIGSSDEVAIATDYGDLSWDRETVALDLLYSAIFNSKNAIVFGGNYYDLPPTSCWLVWDKELRGQTFSPVELAWTNFRHSHRLIRHMWSGFWRKHKEARFHPTQKPLDVMSWAIGLAGDIHSVLDPFAGSGTTLVAAKLRNLKATGIEREERYCEIAANRLAQDVLPLL